MSKRSQTILTAVALLVITLPYLIAAWSGGDEYVFNGFLLNPLDGNSYLAKMRLGFEGSWQFTLPFYENDMDGSFLFLFYIFLGHVSKILSLPLVITFHIARIVSAVVFCVVLARFIKVVIPRSTGRSQTVAYGLIIFGSGLGWLAAFFGGFTSDFWVAEAYPFLSLYSNPHFPLGIALLLGYFIVIQEYPGRKGLVWLVIAGILEAIVLPFAVVVAAVVTVAYQLWEFAINNRKVRWWLLLFLVPGGIFLLYQYFAITINPVLAQWNRQNVTVSPSLGDFLVSFSPALIGAFCALYFLWKQKSLGEYKILIIWMVCGLLLAFIPFQLQRRFLLGYYIPLGCLAVLVFEIGSGKPQKVPNFAKVVLFTISILTNFLILAGGLNAIARKDVNIYYSTEIQAGFDWMESQTENTQLVLASPETGLLIPGQTGLRVIYGHPYETPDAEARKAEVESIFAGRVGKQDLHSYLQDHQVDFIFWGPTEMKYSSGSFLFDAYPSVFKNNSVVIFKTGLGK